MKPFLHILFFLLVGNLSVTYARVANMDDMPSGGAVQNTRNGMVVPDLELAFEIPVAFDYESIYKRSWMFAKGLFVDVEPYQKLSATIDNNGRVKSNTYPCYGYKTEAAKSQDRYFQPFRPVIIDNKSKLGAFDGFGTLFVAPAIFAYYVEKETGIQTATDVTMAGIDITTPAIPAANVTKLGKIFFYADKISSVTSLAADFAEENETTRAVLSGISLATGIVSAGDLATNGLKTRKLYRTLPEAQADFRILLADIEKLSPDEINGLANKEKLAQFIETYGKELNLQDVTSGSVAKLRGTTKILKVGDEIAGIKIERIKAGSNGKTAIIGRAMGSNNMKGVRDVYRELTNKGYKNIEIFDQSSLSGEWLKRFQEASKEIEEWVIQNGGNFLDNNTLMKTKMYNLNKEWAQKLVDEGYEVIDMGDILFKAGNDRGFSLFYSMEKNTIFK